MNLRRLVTLCTTLVLLAACSKPTATPGADCNCAAPTSTPIPPTVTPSVGESRASWRGSIVYEIFPYSFYDSNGDGVGDLRGIVTKLDYIQSLGANTLWLTSVFSSTSTSGLR